MDELTEPEVRALTEALDDEYLAWATYDQVIADFGEMPPFSNIREAEGRHIKALCTLFARYGLPVPENPWPGKVARHASLQAACEAGVAAEIANGEMYERLLKSTQRPEILTVLRNLQEASQQRHLPAFQRCATHSAGVVGGSGRPMHKMGAGGFCICPKCETRLPHHDGVRCQDERCPQCGVKLLREGSEHWALWQAKKNKTHD